MVDAGRSWARMRAWGISWSHPSHAYPPTLLQLGVSHLSRAVTTSTITARFDLHHSRQPYDRLQCMMTLSSSPSEHPTYSSSHHCWNTR
jgi:hypothetical protein